MNSIDVTGFITSGLVSRVQDLVLDKVIGKWKAYRTTKFFETLTYEIAKEYSSQQQSNHLDGIIEKILTKPEAAEMLFEAYRRVCLSTTKDLGPRIIAILTARLLIEERVATEDEESIFTIAEEMRDVEFMEFCNFYVKERLEENLKETSYDYSINTKDLGLHDHFTGTPSSHLTPIMALGKWAGKLEKVGFLYTDTLTENFMRADHREKDVPVIAYHFSIVFEQQISELYQYIRRAQGPKS